ncbi:MAG: tape measure protein [Brevundimonas sp.]|uniref:tape measure protein n=1 Tax=Brevundimonas sp. TaxID=1871086 RepID=UPI00391CB65A
MADVIGSAEFELRASRRQLARDVQNAEKDLKASVQRTEKDYERGGQNAARGWAKGQRDMVRETKRAEGEIRSSAGSIRASIIAMAAPLAALFSIGAITRMGDAWTDLNSRVRLAVGEHENAEAVMGRLTQMARRTYSSLDVTAEGFLQNANAMRELGYTTQTTLNFVEALNNGMVVSGAKGQRAESVMNALSKAMAFGELRGDNLNTVLQSGGRITEVLAASLGVATTELRQMGERGLLTTDVLVQALTGSLEQLRAEADSMPATVADAYTLLGNKLVEYVGQADQSLGATEKMSAAIIKIADNLDDIIPVLAAVTVGVGTAYVAGAIAATGATISFTAALRGLNVAMLVVSRHPLIAVLTIVAAGLTYVAMRGREASAAMQEIDATAQGAADAMNAYEQASREAANAAGANAAAAAQNAARMREEAVAALNSARALYARRAALASEAAQEARNSAEARRTQRENRPSAGRYDDTGADTLRQAALDSRARRLEDEASAAFQAQFQAGYRFAEIENSIRQGAYRVTPTNTGGGGGSSGAARSAGPSEDDLARLREEADIYAKQKRERELFEDAEREIDAILEGRRRQLERDAEFAERELAITRDRLGFELELARLGGNSAAIEAASQRLWIEERINELLRLRPELTREDARSIAENEDRQLGDALRTGQARDAFRSIFVDAADGLDSALMNVADRFRQRLLENLADQIFDAFSGSGGGGIMGFIGGLFGGGRQFGGSVKGGMAYRVGEGGAETFVPASDGYIVPNGGMSSQGGQQRQSVDVRISLDNDMLIATIDGRAVPIAQAEGNKAVRASLSASQKSAPGMQQRMRRLGTP